jgi:16S rRNA (uracil1498-N3)-methyltransferase
MERFYLDDPLKPPSLLLEGPEFHHLAHVMRVRVGEEIELVNGRGVLVKAKVASLKKESAHLDLLHREEHPVPSPHLLLGLSLIKRDRLEWVIEKGTELGAEAFFLFPADRSEKNDLSPNQQERLRHVAISALKQCGRLYLPEIRLFSSLEEVLTTEATILFGDLDPKAPQLAPSKRESTLFITGPEKGFSPKELSLLKQKGQGVRLHSNVLRAETAPLVALGLLSST